MSIVFFSKDVCTLNRLKALAVVYIMVQYHFHVEV